MNAFPIPPMPIPAMPIPAMIVERLGWVLVHSLWQFALIALLVAVAVRLLRRNSAAARYTVLGMAMLVTALIPAATWMLLPNPSFTNPPERTVATFEPPADLASDRTADTESFYISPRSATDLPEWDFAVPLAEADSSWNAPPADVSLNSGSLPSEPSWSARATRLLRPWLGWIVAGWCIGVVLCSMRPLLGWHTLRRLRRVGVSPVSDDVLATLRRVSQRLGMGRAVRVLHSTLARVPIVVGYFRPVIVLPISLVTSIPAAQLEAILAHELAHVRRHDFLVNLLQTLVETVFFYHPAVWWLSSRLRAEREHCCDDLVVAALDNRVEYGRALLAIEELRGRGSVLALGATDGRLLARVRRIVGLPSDTASSSPSPALSLVVCGMVLVCLTSVISWRSQAVADPPPPAKPFVAELPGDIRVEFVGLAPGSVNFTDASVWWKPDGTKLGFAPKYGGAMAASDDPPSVNTVIRVYGVTETGAVTATATISAHDYEKDASGKRYLAHYGHTDVPEDQTTWSFEVGIATEPLSPTRFLDRNGKRLPPPAESPPDHIAEDITVEKAGHQTWATRPQEMDRTAAQLTIQIPLRWRTIDLQFSAIDRAGISHPADFTVQLEPNDKDAAYTRVAEFFAIPFDQVDHFEYQFRLLRHWVTFENVSLLPGHESKVKVRTTSLPVSATDPEKSVKAAREEAEWGEATNGLRARVVPVLSSMSEDAIDPAQRVEKFETSDDIAFVVELENVSDKPIKLLDLWHRARDGKRVPHSDWLSQFVFSIDLFDDDNTLIEPPDVHVDDIALALDGAQIAALEPGKTHRFLIRPARWMTALQPQIQAGSYRVAVRYQGLSARNAARVKEVRPESPLLAAAAVNVASAPVAFEVRGESRTSDLVWGEAAGGLRGAVSFESSKATHAHGEKPAVRLHLQNVGSKHLTLITKLSLPNAIATIKNEKGQPIDLKALQLTGERLNGLLTLKPQQVVVLDAGYLGLAITKERASQFDARTPRRLVAPAGNYSMQLGTNFGNILRWEGGKDKVVLPEAWIGELKTGFTPFEITNEIIECDIVDAATGQAIAGTTVNFRFIKPKSGDTAEEIVADIFWGPKAPSHILFFIPDKVLARADREEIEVEWGVGGHADYEPYRPAERIPLKQFFNEGTTAARETLGTIKLTAKKKADGNRKDIAAPKEGAEAAIDPNGEIVGQLVDEMGKPVAGVTVVCGAVINDSGKGGGAKVVTDAEGRYRLTVPSPGIYSVFIRHLDAEPAEMTRMTAIADDGLLVEAGKITASRMVWMPGTQVGGALVYDKDQPVPNVTVYCYSMAKPQSTAEVMSVKSDDQGRFAFWLPPGRAYLYSYKSLPESADKPDGVKLSVHVPLIVPRNGEIPAQAPPLKLVLAEREPKPLGDPEWLKRVPPGTQILRHADTKVVTGTVVDVDGQPIPGAKVFRYDGPIVTANEQGEFKVTASRGTQFILYAFQPGYQVWSGTPASGDVLKIVLEKKLVAGDQARHAKEQIQPVAVTERARIVPLNDIEMQIQHAGTIVSLKVAAGAMVKKGEVLIIVNTAETAKREDIVAPLDGEVVKVFVRDAEQVKAGQVIVRIVQRDRVRVVGEVKWPGLSPRELIGKIEISPNDKDKFEFPAKVTFIDPIADDNGNHRISVEVENRQQDGKWLLVPGQMAKLTILRADDRDLRERDPRDNPPPDDAKAPAVEDEKIGSRLVPGQFGGVSQTMQIGLDGSISYSDTKNLCQMTLFDDDRLQVGFHNDIRIWTDVTLPLVTGAGGQQRAVWSAEMDGYAYRVTAIPFSTRGCLFRLEKRRDSKLIHGSLQFFAVKSRQANPAAGAELDAPAVPIKHREWRVDLSGTGVVAGRYTGASQPMQIAEDGTISYTDKPLGICHLAVLEDDRLTATFRDARGMPTEVTLPLVTTAAQYRASWSAEIDGHTLRATAVPYSDSVYVFQLEKLRDGKLIEGEQQFYAIDEKLRKASPEEKSEAARLAFWHGPLGGQITLPGIIARLKKQEETLKGCLVTAETKMKQRTGLLFDGPELEREFKTEFRFDDRGRIYSKQQGGVPGRFGTTEVLQQNEVGAFNGQHVTILRGRDEFDWAYRGPDKTRIPREVDPRDYLYWYWNEPLSQLLAQKKYRITGTERWRDRDVVVIESEPTVNEERKASYQGRLLVAPALDYAVVVRSARIRFDDVGPEWHEFSRQETVNYEQDEPTRLWFPKNGTYTSLNPTRELAEKKEAAPLAWKKETTFTLWKPNPEFTDADFTPEIPAGIFVMDEPIPAQEKEDPKPDENSDAKGPPTADEVFARLVSLQAKEMPLKLALAELARQADVDLQLDAEALKSVELDVDEPVTARFQDEPLDEALSRLIHWSDHGGAFREVRAGRLVVTTIAARQQRVAAQLPEWLKPMYTHGLLATLDEEGQVESITTGSIATDELLEKLATLPRLRELHIEVTKTLTPAGLKHLGVMPVLEKLSLYEVNSEGNGLGDEALQAIAGLNSLRELRVSACGLTDAGARHLEGLRQLTQLELNEGRLTDASLMSIGELRHLQHLSLSSYGGTVQYGRMSFTTAGLKSLAGLHELEELHLVGQAVTADLLTWPKLTALSLGGTTVDDACAERIAACRELKSLSLSFSAVSDEGIKQIATLPALRRLNIDSRVITDTSMEHLKAVETLQMLALRTTNLTDESLRHMAEMKSLRRLDLHGSGQPGFAPGESFSINAVRQLKALPRLHTLWLTNFQSPGGYLGLADLTQLRELSLMMADIRTEDLEALEAALPDTTIHCMSGGGFRRPKTKRERKTEPQDQAEGASDFNGDDFGGLNESIDGQMVLHVTIKIRLDAGKTVVALDSNTGQCG